jgi:hypothetical protein
VHDEINIMKDRLSRATIISGEYQSFLHRAYQKFLSWHRELVKIRISLVATQELCEALVAKPSDTEHFCVDLLFARK